MTLVSVKFCMVVQCYEGVSWGPACILTKPMSTSPLFLKHIFYKLFLLLIFDASPLPNATLVITCATSPVSSASFHTPLYQFLTSGIYLHRMNAWVFDCTENPLPLSLFHHHYKNFTICTSRVPEENFTRWYLVSLYPKDSTHQVLLNQMPLSTIF